MDPLTVALGALVATYGLSLVVDPGVPARIRPRDLPPDEPGVERPAEGERFDRSWRTFGAVATLVGLFAVGVGTGVV